MCLRLSAWQISLYSRFTVGSHDAVYRSRRWLEVYLARNALQISPEVQGIIVTNFFNLLAPELFF